MPAFAATVIDALGRERSGVWDAADATALRARLRAESLWPVRIAGARPDRRFARLSLPTRELVALLHQLELQVLAGVTPDAALAQLATDLPAGPARSLLAHLHREVAQGSPIHVACRACPRIFPAELAAVVAAGEASARLPEALRALAAHLASNEELRRTARRALIYPGIVLTATAGLIVFLLGGVVPRFAEIFSSLHITLPWLTVALIKTSELLRQGWPMLAAVATLAGAALIVATRAPRLRLWRDRLALRLPVLGETFRCLSTARVAAHVRLMHEAGVPLLAALATGAELAGNAAISRDLLAARTGVAAGKTLCDALPSGHHLPNFFVPALRAGETTGQLAAALRHIETYAATRAREQLATALAWLEPVTLTALTAIVGAIALSFFLPLFALLGGVNAR
ncbi:MAG: type II secretion system F family protein [Opitutaceae bacterium]|nr:type II secretion system F family protein [Opitutaceae bacterium]